MSATVVFDELPLEQQVAVLWRAGDLSWKLDDHQLRVYRKYRAWERLDPRDDSPGDLTRVFVLDIARRWGKTAVCLVIKNEDCIRDPGSIHTYACAFGKDIGEIILPLQDELLGDAPEDCRAEYRSSKKGRRHGLYFPNGSVLRLVGIDRNPQALRGRASSGFVVGEAGHVKKLKPTTTKVIYPQFQRRPKARMILESNAPEDPAHDFDTFFVPDAKLRDAHVFLTIDDNQAIDQREKAEFIRAAGGRGNPVCEREYYGVRARDQEKAVVPEFSEQLHVQALDVPRYADCYVSLDPGFRDLFAVLWAYWDFEHARLVVQRDWAERNASAAQVAEVIKAVELELWEHVRRWNGKELKANPRLRVSDTDPRLLGDFARDHGLRIAAVNKSTGAKTELKEAGVHSVRAALGRGQIIIDPCCAKLIAHLNAARWNEARTDYERSELFGHYDLLDALVYLWRSILRNRNATPPAQLDVPHDQIFAPPEARLRPLSSTARAIDMVLGGKKEAERRSAWKPERNARWKRQGS